MRKWIYLFLIPLAFTFVVAGKMWEDKPYTQWSQKETASFLRRSPWTQEQIIRDSRSGFAPSPREGSGTVGLGSSSAGGQTTSRAYMIGFLSARPMMMGLARWAVLNGALAPEAAGQFVADNQYTDQIVISVTVPPGQDLSDLRDADIDYLQETTFLHLKKSKRKIALAQYVAPSQARSNEGLFIFPRQENGRDLVTLAEDEVKFESRLNRETKLSKKFKLKNMVFDGQLEI